jgi:hypothetical protein
MSKTGIFHEAYSKQNKEMKHNFFVLKTFITFKAFL